VVTNRLARKQHKVEVLEAERKSLDFHREHRKQCFAGKMSELKSDMTELQQWKAQNLAFQKRNNHLTWLRFQELCLKGQLHLTKGQCRALYYEGKHAVIIPTMMEYLAIDQNRALSLQYWRRLQIAFVNTEQKLALLTQRRDALVSAHTEMIHTFESKPSQAQFQIQMRNLTRHLERQEIVNGIQVAFGT
jgi:hypothetical protein